MTGDPRIASHLIPNSFADAHSPYSLLHPRSGGVCDQLVSIGAFALSFILQTTLQYHFDIACNLFDDCEIHNLGGLELGFREADYKAQE